MGTIGMVTLHARLAWLQHPAGCLAWLLGMVTAPSAAILKLVGITKTSILEPSVNLFSVNQVILLQLQVILLQLHR